MGDKKSVRFTFPPTRRLTEPSIDIPITPFELLRKRRKSEYSEDDSSSFRAASLVGSVTSADSRTRVRSFPVWSEFNENEINAEKWDSAGKGKEKGKSPSMQVFDDPEGRLEMPASVRVSEWKRPHEFTQDATVVIDEKQTDLDLLTPNQHICHSELMRWIISQLSTMWNLYTKKSQQVASSARLPSTPDMTDEDDWRPWHHIFASNKVGKGPALYNPYGKYVVKLFWMGCWRRIVIDDQMPFDANGQMLLPATNNKNELWPMLLSKALIKIASINYNPTNGGCEFGDFFVMHSLTGWLPETIPLRTIFEKFLIHKKKLVKEYNQKRKKRRGSYYGDMEEDEEPLSGNEWYGHMQNVWDLLKQLLPTWVRPEFKEPKETEPLPVTSSMTKKDRLESSVGKADSGSAQKAAKGKDKKKEDREKSKSSPHSARPHSARSTADIKSAVDEPAAARVPETVVFATFTHPTENPPRVAALKEMSDSSEKLRRVGLSHLHPHPLQVTVVRDIPLIKPPPKPVIPQWKLIRPRKKRTTPSDEPIPEPEPPKPDQWLEITSDFINHKISPLPLDPNAVKSRSSPRGVKSSRPSTAGTLKDIEETTEGANNDNEVREDGLYRAQQVSSQSRRSMKSRISVEDSRAPSINERSESVRESEAPTADGEKLENSDTINDKNEDKESSQPPEPVRKNAWIDFEDFCKCFQTLVIFHKPSTYTCTQSTTEIKHSVINGLSGVTSGTGKKGSANPNQPSSGTNVKSTIGQTGTKAYEGFPAEERQPVFLFVDHVDPIELVVSLSVLSRWPGMESERRAFSDKDSVAGVSEALSMRDSSREPPPQGLLIAEQFTWKTVVTGQPVLRVKTSGIRASCLTLPAGRHVLKILFDTPLGYSLTVTSRVEFKIGDEETIMKLLEKESCRFIATAQNIITGVGDCIKSIGNKDEWLAARKRLHRAHMPFKPSKAHSKSKHYQIWHRAFYDVMLQVLNEDREKPLVRALRLFTLDCAPMSVMPSPLQRDETEVHESWVNREPTPDETKAIVRLQRAWRGTYARTLRRELKQQEDDVAAKTTKEVLLKAWESMQTNAVEHGLKILRNMLEQDPDMIRKYSFYKDEWNKISYTDYSGSYQEQPKDSWFIVFREVFYASCDVLCLPKLYIPLKTCILRVVDNDTNEEVKTVFQKVAPHVYKKNKRGYTFVAEAYTHPNQEIQGDKWKMRLIGAKSPLPAPISGQINTQFIVKEIKDYYIPNDKHILLRYHVKASANHIASIQLKTSLKDVYIKLQLLDNEKEVVSSRGKGHCVVPAFCFLTNEKSERPSSRISNQDSRHMIAQPSKQSVANSGKKRTGSAKSKDGKTSPKQSRKQSGDIGKPAPPVVVVVPTDDEEDNVIHKYTIQAVVERKSWPLSESQWAYVQKLKELEKEEIKAYTANKDRPGSPGATRAAGKPAGGEKKKGKGGDKKEKKTHDKETGSRPPSQSVFDESKAYWLLRFVSDADLADNVEVPKDVDRQEEIRAMKLAWEAAEPGRAIKALQSRLAYLTKKGINKENEAEEEAQKEDQESLADEQKSEIYSLAPPPHLIPKPVFEGMDLNAFYRPKLSEVQQVYYMNEEAKQAIDQSAENRMREYQSFRENVIGGREKEKQDRLKLKQDQINTYQEMQYTLDEARFELAKPREAYRQALLDEERRKKEEEEARLAALEGEERAGSASPKGKKSGKKSAGKKK